MKKKGPDSLEGLFVLAVVCLISTLMYGMVGLSSMLFVASVTRYNTDRNKASFPYVLSTVLQALSGPFAGYFARKFSVRIVVLAGSVLAFLGIGACFFAQDIAAITVLWGIVYGTGFGLSSLLLPVVINEYFVKQRSVALGMCYLGSPIGFFTFPPLFELFLEKYGLSGTFLILSGINLHCVPLSMLLKQPNWEPKYENSPLKGKSKTESYMSTNSRPPNQTPIQTAGSRPDVVLDRRTRRHSVEFLWTPPILPEKLGDGGKKYVLSLNKNRLVSPESSVDICRSFKKTARNRYEHPAAKGDGTATIYVEPDNSCSSMNTHWKSNDYQPHKRNTQARESPRCYENRAFEASDKSINSLKASAEKRSEILRNLDYERISTIYFGAESHSRRIGGKESPIENRTNFRDVQANCENGLIPSNILKFNGICKRPIGDCVTNTKLLKFEKTDKISDRVDKKEVTASEKHDRNSLLKMCSDPIFILVSIITAIVNFHFTALTTVIIDFSRDRGIGLENEKYIMMVVSLSGAFGMLGFGWVTDGGHLSRTACGALSQLVGGACTAGLPFTDGLGTFLLLVGAWCTCQSSFIPLIPAVTAEYFAEDVRAVAIAASNVLSGPLYLTIPPLIGYFRDSQGSYDNIFFLLGILSLLNFIAVSAIPCLARWRLKT